MISEMRGWKVLADGRHSTGGNFRIFGTVYPKDQLVVSSLARSMLFFFADKEQANEYAICNFEKIIVPCIAYGCRRIKVCAVFTNDIKQFWKEKLGKRKTSIQVCPTPKGTWVAEAIRCLE